MLKSRARELSSNKPTAKIRTPKKPVRKTRTNLLEKSDDRANIAWDSNRARLELLSPQQIKSAKENLDKAKTNPINPFVTDLEYLEEKINIAKNLTSEMPDSNHLSPDLKATIAVLTEEGRKMAEKLQRMNGSSAASDAQEQRIRDLENTITCLKLDLERARTDASVMVPRMTSSEAQVTLTEDIISSLRAENVNSKTQILEANDVISKLKSALQSQESEIKRLKKDIESEELSKKKSSERIDDIESLRIKLQAQLKKKEMEVNRFAARNKMLENKVKGYESSQEVNDLQRALNKASCENLAATDEITRLRQELSQSLNRFDGMVGEKSRLEKELSDLNPRLNTLVERDDLIRRLHARLAESEHTIQILESRSASHDSAKISKISDLEHKLAAAEVELARLKRDNLDKEMTLKSSNDKLAIITAQSENKLNVTESKLEKKKSELSSTGKELEKLKEKYAILKEKYERTELELKDKTREINNIRQSDHELITECEAARQLAKKTSNQLIRIQDQCNHEQSKRKTAERQLELAVNELRKTENKYESVKDNHKIEINRQSANLEAQMSRLNAEVLAGKEQIREVSAVHERKIEELTLKLRQAETMNASLQDYCNYLKSMSDALTTPTSYQRSPF